jgi:hypothetical protein
LHHRFSQANSQSFTKEDEQAQITTFEVHCLVSSYYFDNKYVIKNLVVFVWVCGYAIFLFGFPTFLFGCPKFLGFCLDLRDFKILGRQSKQKTVFVWICHFLFI